MADLRSTDDERLNEPLDIWRRYRDQGRVANAGSLPPDLARLATSVAELFGWTDDRARAAEPTAQPPGGTPSMGGTAGLYQLAEAVGRGELAWSMAINAARDLDIGDDDVMFLVAFAAMDKTYGAPSTAGAIMGMAGEIVSDDALGARLQRSLAALTQDQDRQRQLFTLADLRLSGGADDRLRAEIWNEVAILMMGQGRFEEGGEVAVTARELALANDDQHVASMALGNQAFALMQQRRFAEAIAIFDRLAAEQAAAGDAAGLAVTQENLELCKANLGAVS